MISRYFFLESLQKACVYLLSNYYAMYGLFHYIHINQ